MTESRMKRQLVWTENQLKVAHQQCAAQLVELEAISTALGTSEGHSSVAHILDLRQQLAYSQKQVTLLRDVLQRIAFSRVGKCESLTQELFNRETWAAEALAATEPKK